MIRCNYSLYQEKQMTMDGWVPEPAQKKSRAHLTWGQEWVGGIYSHGGTRLEKVTLSHYGRPLRPREQGCEFHNMFKDCWGLFCAVTSFLGQRPKCGPSPHPLPHHPPPPSIGGKPCSVNTWRTMRASVNGGEWEVLIKYTRPAKHGIKRIKRAWRSATPWPRRSLIIW